MLKQQYKEVRQEDCAALTELWKTMRKMFINLCQAEWHRRRSRERARKHTAFIANPFGFTMKQIGQK